MQKIVNLQQKAEIVRVIKSGGIVLLPTDTQYGLVCSIDAKNTVGRIFSTKERQGKPGTLIAATTQQLVDLGIDEGLVSPLEKYWPAPLSVIFPMSDAYSYVHLGLKSNAIRIPDFPELLELLEETGVLVTTSANLAGQPPVESIQEAMDLFGDAVDLYVDGGLLENRPPSTVARYENGEFVVLRQGAFKPD